tara:strand:+ start:12450 stop:12860 length:411 start_codon:yes stop_codon:yes gene_type:complete
MPTPSIVNSFKEAVAEGVHDLGSDVLKIALTNAAPSVSDTQLSDITQIGAGNGYTTGGATATVSSSAQSGGIYSLVLAAVTFTAAGGDIGPFRYGVLYNDTAAADELIAFIDYGSAYTLANGLNFTFTASTWLQNA